MPDLTAHRQYLYAAVRTAGHPVTTETADGRTAYHLNRGNA